MEPQGCRQGNRTARDLSGRGSTIEELNRDSRYRSIIGHLDHMLALLRLQPGRDLGAELDQLVSATMGQVAPEEGFMELVQFPGTGQHRLRHQFICIATAKLRYRFLKRVRVLPEELDHLRMLWLEHIEVHDGAFEDFLVS